MLLTPYMQKTAIVIPYIIAPIIHASMLQSLLSNSVNMPPKIAVTSANKPPDVKNNPIAVKIL